MTILADTIRELVIANRILAREGVVDAFGHVSIRHPENPERYLLSRSRAPELIEPGDIMEFTLDGEAVDLRGRTPYGERMIHGAIYELRPEVQSVIHNHSCELIPFSVTDAPLRPIMHTCAVIGSEIPRWDIRDKFGDTDHLVVTMEQGRDLAGSLAGNRAMLMRRHGSVVVGGNVKEAVMNAVYMQANAKMQMQAMQLGTPDFLNPAETEKCIARQMSPLAIDRAWEYWCIRAGSESL
ncbi:MAG: class II aldolase/adducin family protein [Alphaproteobacteria bacterium]|nr:class II aldolase/adducin family protein [Alphaproteobacteria bacterium]